MNDLLAGAGALTVCVGAALVYLPVGVILAGMAMLMIAFNRDKERGHE